MEKHNSEYTGMLDSFAGYLSAKGRSENTIKTYIGVLQLFLQWMNTNGRVMNELSSKDIEDYLDFLENKQKRSTSTIKKTCNTLNTFAKSIGRPEIVQDIPVFEKEEGEFFPEAMTEKEVQELLNQIEKDGNKRNIAIAYTLLETGVRVSELCSLNIRDIELNSKHHTGQLTVRGQGNDQQRTIPLPKSLVHHLKEYLETRMDEEKAVFLSNYNKRISSRTVQHMLKQYGVYPHKLRHTFCYRLIEKGLDVSIVAQLAGHSDIHVTKQYIKAVKLAEEEIKEA
ncbi:tyrosine-type recombinase/integrase [Evansella sp. LMS18]|uniref:tyrosine-type recombinase/integrase n=1 Tax=Evansella sp. LMS18 TaxID=2924033 RepID=UPI0020D03683|nr:tyrosine-type recombinase/integrase [Evansella sp. LMS18]UTR08606.1 tyrosine-type recombinase/integrase [Evansella sp. LMS18]